jgi:DNA invertase Pin-like site-specific DNA recombinase
MIHVLYEGGRMQMKLGYARSRVDDKSLEDQVKVLQEHGCEKIYTDHKVKSDGLGAMLEYAREGDTVIIPKLQCMAQSIQELNELATQMNERKINLISLDQNLDTTADNGELVFQMINIIAEFEREAIIERVKSGIQNAREKGIKLGRKSADIQQKEKAYEMYFSREYTMKEITDATKLSRATIYRYIEYKKAENNVK